MKNLLPIGAYSFLMSRPHFGRTSSTPKANRKSQKLFPSVWMTKNFMFFSNVFQSYQDDKSETKKMLCEMESFSRLKRCLPPAAIRPGPPDQQASA